MTYLSPGERRRKNNTQAITDSQRDDRIKKIRGAAAIRQISELLQILNDEGLNGARPVELIKPLGRFALKRADPDMVGMYPGMNRRKNESWLPNRVKGFEVIEVTAGWPISRKDKAPRDGTNSFSTPITEHNHLLLTKEGLFFSRFEPARAIGGYAAMLHEGTPFDIDDEHEKLKVPQKELIVDHLRYHAARIDARHAR